MIELQRQLNRLEAQYLRRLEAFDRRGGARVDGPVSTAGWLRCRNQLGPGAAHERVQVARALADRLPATAGALAAGDISYRHAAVLVHGSADLPPHAVVEAEPDLVEKARRFNPGLLRRIVQHWRHVIDAERARRDADEVYERNRLDISTTWAGRGAINGMLDPEGGAVVLAAVQALSAPVPGDTRPPWQRRADALVQLGRRALDAGELPDAGGERPHVVVTMDVATLEARVPSPGAELDWTGPISGEAARRLACDASVVRVITRGTSEILDVGRMTRAVPPAMRRALVFRDGGCGFPSCDRPPPWCDAHHIVHWADGGPTALANLILLCRLHHRLLHEGRWRLARAPDGSGWVAHRGAEVAKEA